MSDKRNKNSGLSSFLYALVGALIGGLLVFLLTGGFASQKANDSNELSSKDVEAIVDRRINKELKAQLEAKDESPTMESLVVEKSLDSVVGISTKAEVMQRSVWGFESGYATGWGSGSIVSSDGYILTNSHVVSDGDVAEINVLFNDGTNEPAELIWNDATLDLAIIKVNRDNLPVMDLGDSDKVGVGDRVVAIGNPLGYDLQSTVTSGIISGLNRTVGFQTGAQIFGLMQTDAAINSGNSGGALLNAKGEQIGINTAKAGNTDGIGFAIPINTVKAVIDQVKKTGSFSSVYLGITGQSVEYLRQLVDAKEADDLPDGVYVMGSFDGSDAFKEGDIITAVDGKKVTDMSSLRKTLLNYQVGESAKITIYRDGKKMDVDFDFTIDSSNVDEYKMASPENKIEEDDYDNRRRTVPFFNLP